MDVESDRCRKKGPAESRHRGSGEEWEGHVQADGTTGAAGGEWAGGGAPD